MAVAHARAPLGGWLAWGVANVAGYALGFALWQAIFPALRPALSATPGGFLLVAGFGATVGVCAGLAQAVARREQIARASAWVLAVMLGTAAGFTVAAKASESLNAVLEPRLDLSLTDAALVLWFGGIVGITIGVARWLALLAQGIRAARWILASAVGLLIGYPLAIGMLQLLPELDQPLVGLVFGVCMGAAAALLEWLITAA
jgi:hypothetical protein